MEGFLSSLNQNSLKMRLKKIKAGDEVERERLISDYIPFIIKTIVQVTNRYIEVENNDEFAIGLAAFNEAIDKYNFRKGNFIKFAQTVIRNRIIDYQRKIYKQKEIISINHLEDEEGKKTQFEFEKDHFTYSLEVKEQLEQFKEKLGEFGIRVEDLVRESPKHIDTKLNAINIARYILDNDELKEDFYRKKFLPSTKIIERLGISAKVIKRSRKFIIATVLILDSELEILKDYIGRWEQEVKRDA